MNTRTYHRTAIVNGRTIFYREAGDPAAAATSCSTTMRPRSPPEGNRAALRAPAADLP
jgi:hypothetical protein